MKYIGILVLINVVIIAAYTLIASTVDGRKVLSFAAVGLFASLALILGERITGVKVSGVGEISAATQRAVASAEHIEAIQKEVEAHRDAITLIVRDGNKAREEIGQISEYVDTARKRTDEIEAIQKRAEQNQKDLAQVADFNILLSRATNDDRQAFDALIAIATRPDDKFKTLALNAIVNIATGTLGAITFEITDWAKYGFDPAKASVAEYGTFIETHKRADFQVSAIAQLWRQDRFTKREKLQFLVNVLLTTQSIRVLNSAAMTINEEAKIEKNILAWPEYMQWWAKNIGNYPEKPAPAR